MKRTTLMKTILVFFLSSPVNTYAVEKIFYQGMHFKKAWIKVDGRLNKLAPGQRSKQGVELLELDKDFIVIRLDGKRYRYEKGSSQGELLMERVVLQRSAGNGGYWARGFINNSPVTFIVDTGASYVVLSKDLARKLKIRRGNKKVEVFTATKKETAYEVVLDSVRVGGISLSNIPALITNHDHPPSPLLGMTYLRHVDMVQSDGQMMLQYGGE